jgi:aryl-alcohol dehydrogenase-like predicted oxidoreductase
MSDFRKHVPLGQTGLEVSRLGIGSSFTGDPAFIEEAVDQGLNDLYWGSIRRPAFGRAMRNVARGGRRDDLVLVVQSYTRVAALMGPSVEVALRRAGVDCFDLLLLSTAETPWPH